MFPVYGSLSLIREQPGKVNSILVIEVDPG